MWSCNKSPDTPQRCFAELPLPCNAHTVCLQGNGVYCNFAKDTKLLPRLQVKAASIACCQSFNKLLQCTARSYKSHLNHVVAHRPGDDTPGLPLVPVPRTGDNPARRWPSPCSGHSAGLSLQPCRSTGRFVDGMILSHKANSCTLPGEKKIHPVICQRGRSAAHKPYFQRGMLFLPYLSQSEQRQSPSPLGFVPVNNLFPRHCAGHSPVGELQFGCCSSQ